MTRFRSQRGSLAESLKTVVEINDAAGLLAHLQKILAPAGARVPYASDFGIWTVMNSDGFMRHLSIRYRIIDKIYFVMTASSDNNQISLGCFSNLQKALLYVINGYRIAKGSAHQFDGA
jgi:hypothetical protein